MTQQLPPRRFYPCAENATDHPVLLIDSEAPLPDLHACLRERLNAALEHLNLSDQIPPTKKPASLRAFY